MLGPIFLQVSKYIAFFHRRFLVFHKGVATERHGNPPIPVQENRITVGDGFEIEETSAGFRRLGNPDNIHALGGEESEGRRNTFFLHKEENRFI